MLRHVSIASFISSHSSPVILIHIISTPVLHTLILFFQWQALVIIKINGDRITIKFSKLSSASVVSVLFPSAEAEEKVKLRMKMFCWLMILCQLIKKDR